MADDLSKKLEAEKALREAVKNFDHEGCQRRVVWSLNEPICCCAECYNRWLEWGKEVYKNQPERYEERKKEALLNLEHKRESRRIDEKTRVAIRKQTYSCSVA